MEKNKSNNTMAAKHSRWLRHRRCQFLRCFITSGTSRHPVVYHLCYALYTVGFSLDFSLPFAFLFSQNYWQRCFMTTAVLPFHLSSVLLTVGSHENGSVIGNMVCLVVLPTHGFLLSFCRRRDRYLWVLVSSFPQFLIYLFDSRAIMTMVSFIANMIWSVVYCCLLPSHLLPSSFRWRRHEYLWVLFSSFPQLLIYPFDSRTITTTVSLMGNTVCLAVCCVISCLLMAFLAMWFCRRRDGYLWVLFCPFVSS